LTHTFIRFKIIMSIEMLILFGDIDMLKSEDDHEPNKLKTVLLIAAQMERYFRHTRLPEVGVEGQRKLPGLWRQPYNNRAN